MSSKGIGGHHRNHARETTATDEWLTPKWLIDILGPFDLDPCSPVDRPWPTAAKHYTIEDDGLSLPWEGRVWLNPPYGREAVRWLEKMKVHRKGIALLFARTETEMFHTYVWPHAAGLYFLRGRLSFHTVTGAIKGNAGGPTVLIAYDVESSKDLRDSGLPGCYIDLHRIQHAVYICPGRVTRCAAEADAPLGMGG